MTDRETALQARVEELETYLAMLRRHPLFMAEILGITPTQARILGALRDASPARLLQADIERLIFSSSEVSYHLVHVHISKMRRRLALLAIEIDSSRGHKTPGWGLTPEMVARIDAIVEQKSAGLVGSAA